MGTKAMKAYNGWRTEDIRKIGTTSEHTIATILKGHLEKEKDALQRFVPQVFLWMP